MCSLGLIFNTEGTETQEITEDLASQFALRVLRDSDFSVFNFFNFKEALAIISGDMTDRPTTLAAHLDIDAIYELIVGGLVFRADSPAEDWWQLELARDHIGLLAISFADHGVLPIVDDVIPSRAVLKRYSAILPRPIRLVVLAPQTQIALQRDAGREKQVADRWAHLAESMSQELSALGLWLDSSHFDASSTIKMVKAGWDEAVLT